MSDPVGGREAEIERHTYGYVACRIEGPNLIVARRCRQCGALAVLAPGYLIGRLPEACRREHGHESVEVYVEVPNVS